MTSPKLIIITMGDPKGIGPEVIVKALTSGTIQDLLVVNPYRVNSANLSKEFNFLVVGSENSLLQIANTLNINLNIRRLASPTEQCIPMSSGHKTLTSDNTIFLFEPPEAGKDPNGGLEYIISALEIIQNNPPPLFSALVTAPVSKENIQKSGKHFVGHTELLAQKTLSRKVTMMFVSPQLKVSLVTTHIAYKKVLLHLTAEKILITIEQTNEGLKKYFGIARPRLAVCGLNPHSGEGGIFGKEENTIIKPAIESAKRKKILCEGPFAPDSIFHQAIAGAGFDAVIALYHDQGLIPIKTLSFHKAVQVTLGLPFIRTSPAHGVAYDIAGRGIANPSSMIESIKLAISMTGHTT
ncbi:MAG: 4-hydroxythreonine-4-phosphate dehydrogenase PdxA, partial [Planctomycetota bacterium]|nr:4-hydroxythreonine-4-phosphate dehydrogenase PdxA [Planctomycetota bacterium]